MREFFGFGEYTRPAEGFLSWQHLTFVTCLMATMIALSWIFGSRNRQKEISDKNKVLMAAAVAIDTLELFKIIILCVRSQDPWNWLYELPLFLCSIQLITIPLAAFSKGRVKNASLDFVFIFGILGAVLGTYGAGNNYSAYPVLSFDNVISGLTHSISGFASLYIAFSGMASMKRRNFPVVCGILSAFCVMASIANHLLDYNYMFLVRGDGTPYDIAYNLVNGHPVWYPLIVIGLFFVYIGLFYGVYAIIKKARLRRKRASFLRVKYPIDAFSPGSTADPQRFPGAS